ncbi:hypothetical protein Pmar_PMAR017313 [Perkinsus marinus ATCC 50983]|uniref:Uncharacterized protein n=1 Tax=Perkinsus marinus (strain ATCC 50983 / TXsc) TaxID=423536 RepID=C5LH90_PERM5|nr:hypothetical protein Pmar_PMAR017313 [Perkinsus marinus ATCC 50983]EER03899.1 hypothetical protein Pmar_PMAR017313 [Perkinsus marinus ATCC 50983]|eukprot:XP_002772083.1 hypothetical protein Pmar_PMAR017313 [Perkinsus marinus ATCC 50983]
MLIRCSDVGSNAFTSSALEQLTCTFSRQMHAIHADAGDMRIFDFIAFPSQPTIRLLLIVPLVSQESPHLPLDRWQDSPTEDELAISAAQLMGRPSLRDIAIEDVDRASLDDRQRKAVMGVVLEANRVNQLVSMQRSCTAEDLGALLNSDRLANDECHRLLSAIRFLPGIFGCRRVNGSYQSPSSFAAIAIADVGVCGPYLVKFSQEYNCTIHVLTPADGAYSSYLKFMAPQQ